MPQDGLSIPAPTPMPKEIAKAILEATKKVKSALKTGEGEEGMRSFGYATINDVLDAAHDTLNEHGLHIIPIEIACHREWAGLALWGHYEFKFRLVHQSGASWIDDLDTRHISLVLSGQGINAGKAQSLVLRDYLKGLLRIRTTEPNLEDEGATRAAPATPKTPQRPNATLPFTFEASEGLKSYTVEEVVALFGEKVVRLPKARRKEWEDANMTGMRMLKEADSTAWLHIRQQVADDK